MGWWIRGQSSKGKGKGKGTKGRSQAGADPSRRAARWRAVLWLVVLGGMVGGLYFGRSALVEQVGAAHGTAVSVELIDAPAWMGENRLQKLRSILSEVVSTDPLDRASLEQACRVYAASPWVERVIQIRREPAGQLSVQAVYRQPVALIGAHDGFHLVDVRGHRLPGVYNYEQSQQLKLTSITGVRAAPPLEGDLWPGDDVQAGITLAMRLARESFAGEVRIIDVANFDGRVEPGYPHLLLITPTGAVRWGRAIGAEEIYEPSADQKLAMLRRVGQTHGSIDAGGQVVDVFLDTPMIHTAEQTRYTSVSE